MPCCCQTLETTAHVFQCADSAVWSNRNTLLQSFDQRLRARNIPSPVHKCLLQGLHWYLLSPVGALPKPIPNTLGNIYPQEAIARNAFHAQATLGWDQCFQGRLSRAWGRAILFNLTGEKREEKAEMMVRWMIKQLVNLSLVL